MNGSQRFKLSVADVGSTLVFAFVVGVAAIIENLIRNSESLNLGSWQSFVIPVMAALLEIARRWMSDNQVGEIVPFSALAQGDAAAKAKKAGIILLVMSPLALMGASWTPDATDNVATVEVNTFGDQPRTAVIYRDGDNSIVDWRWLSSPEMVPQPIGGGRNVAMWKDQGRPRAVYCTSVRYTRTREDRELAERAQLPEHKRRKLSR